MNDFQTRFAEMKKAIGLSRNADFARLLGVEPQNVHNWVKTRGRIGSDSRLLFQEKTGISFDWLNDGIGSMWLDSQIPRKILGSGSNLTVRETTAQYLPGEAKSGYKRLRLMERHQSPGWAIVNKDYPEVLESIDIAEWKVKQQLGFLPTDDRVQLMTNRGSSNYPKIKDGDVVMVDTSQTIFGGDDFYLVDLHGHVVIKRLQLMLDGMHVSSTNQDYKSEVIPAKQLAALPIVGRVVGFAQFRRSEEV